MNFPIPVNMTVSESVQQYGFSVSETDIPVDFEVATPVVANTIPDYEGPYSVTPSESVQTLETDGKAMTSNVTVGAIPSDYVGSAVPRRTKNDINITKIVMPGGVQKPVAIAAKGYYQSTTVKDIPTGTATTPATSITANPTVSVDSNGLVTASVSASQSVTPTVDEGYVVSGTDGTVSVQGSSTLQLSTQAGETITPTESEQTAVSAQKYTTGDVKVAAIPSDYIGSEVPQKSSSDMTASGATVTAPAGYYAEAASKAVPSGSASTPDTSIPVHMDVSLSATGLITATASGSQSVTPNVVEGYVDRGTAGTVSVDSLKKVQLSTQAAKTVTPTESEQTAVASGKYTTGEVKVGAIPSNYVGSSVPTQAAQTITPTTTNQTIASGKYLTGAQTILGDANLVPESIVENITIFGVTGNAPPPVTVVHLI